MWTKNYVLGRNQQTCRLAVLFRLFTDVSGDRSITFALITVFVSKISIVVAFFSIARAIIVNRQQACVILIFPRNFCDEESYSIYSLIPCTDVDGGLTLKNGPDILLVVVGDERSFFASGLKQNLIRVFAEFVLYGPVLISPLFPTLVNHLESPFRSITAKSYCPYLKARYLGA